MTTHLTFYKRIIHLNLVLSIVLLLINHSSLFAGDNSGKLQTIVIDPGHGGQDPGALGSKVKEKDIVLGVGLKLGKLINENLKDVKVIFTRNEDVFIPLHERAEIANRNNADLFVSIHANANKNHAAYGCETYAMGLHKNEGNLEVAKKENAVITFEKDYSTHYEGYDPNSAESFIIFSLIQNTYLEQSLDFAGIVQNNFEKSAQRTTKGVKQAGFLVLWKTSMPAVLIETGFVTNPDEEKFLSSEEGQMKIAQSIFKSFVEYKAQIESKSNFNTQKSQTKEEKYETFDTTPIPDTNIVAVSDDISFRVQIVASPNHISLKSKTFKKCKTIKGFTKVDEISSGNTFKYTIGNTQNYKDILEVNKNVKKVYPKAFVIALKNGKIVPLNDVLKR